MAETTPVTVLTGFLGAGKTTLLNHLLRQPGMARTLVLVNEFGEIGLDHLLVEKLGESTVLVNAGCLCCTVRGDLARVLRMMLPRARRDEISRIVIETTGLADPVPILATLITDPAAAGAYRLDGVLTVVDAVNGAAQLDEQEEAVRQVAVADRIVVSKADLADTTALRARLATLNPEARVIEAVDGAVDPEFVLDVGVFDAAAKVPEVRGWLNEAAFETGADHEHQHSEHRHVDRNRHDGGIASHCVTFEQPLDRDRVTAWLEGLASRHGDKLLRLKAILNLVGDDRPVAVHAVRHLVHAPVRLAGWPVGDTRTSRLVLVTRDLPSAVIEEELGTLRGRIG